MLFPETHSTEGNRGQRGCGACACWLHCSANTCMGMVIREGKGIGILSNVDPGHQEGLSSSVSNRKV